MAMFQDEWKLIYEQFYKPLYLYALSLTGNKHDAEDLIQETFVKAYLSYENKGSIKYWLIVVLKNEFLQMQRKRKKEILKDEDTRLASQQDILTDLIEQEERKQLFREITWFLKAYLKALNIRYKNAWVWDEMLSQNISFKPNFPKI